MKPRPGLILVLLIVGVPSAAISLFVYGGLATVTKTCIATTDEYDRPTYGTGGDDYYYAKVNCSGQTITVATSTLHWSKCYVMVNDTVTVEFHNFFPPRITTDNRCPGLLG